jgi:hypothetical protein
MRNNSYFVSLYTIMLFLTKDVRNYRLKYSQEHNYDQVQK